MFEGDCNNSIYLWEPTSAATWNIEKTPFTGHTDSVEDLQVCTHPPSNTFFGAFQCSVSNISIFLIYLYV